MIDRLAFPSTRALQAQPMRPARVTFGTGNSQPPDSFTRMRHDTPKDFTPTARYNLLLKESWYPRPFVDAGP